MADIIQEYSFGSCTKMNVKELSQEAIGAIAYCCNTHQQEVSRVAFVTRRAFLPKLGYNGLNVKAGETVIVIDPGIGDKLVTIEIFLSVFTNNQYHSLLKGQICHAAMEAGEDQTQFWSGFHLVHKPTETVYFNLYHLLTESEVIAGKSQTEASCIDRAIARSIPQGRGLRFPCNDRTDKV